MKLLFDISELESELESNPRTREGLAQMVDDANHSFDRLSDAQYRALSDQAQAEYDLTRIDFISGQMRVETPHLGEARNRLQECIAVNRKRKSGHVGIMLDGGSTLGKTTILEALIEYVYRKFSEQVPDHKERDFIPVVYVEVPAGSRGKSLMTAFADFLGLPVAPRETMASIRKRVAEAMRRGKTQLVVVDELHNLADVSANYGESVDILKELHNEVHATFIYAGIDLTSGKLLSGPRGQQLRARFSMLGMERFRFRDPKDKAVWKSLVKAFGRELPLRASDQDLLTSLSDYTLARSGGSIGSLVRLLSTAAIRLIENPETVREEINLALMDAITLDQEAESSFRALMAGKNPPFFSEEHYFRTVFA